MKILGAQAPWPLVDSFLGERLDQRDPRMSDEPQIKPYGCAMMLCLEAGRYLEWLHKGGADDDDPKNTTYPDPITPIKAMGFFRAGRDSLGVIREDCYITDWDKVMDFAAGYDAVDYIGHVDDDYERLPEELVFDVWRRDGVEGVHFTWQHFDTQRDIGIQYDPLGSFQPGLSNTRHYGHLVSRRAFRIRTLVA